MSIQESLKIVSHGEVAVVEWDLVGEKVNKLSSPVMVRFKEIIDELKNSSFKAVILLSKKKNIFIAGADIDEIKKFFSSFFRLGDEFFQHLNVCVAALTHPESICTSIPG